MSVNWSIHGSWACSWRTSEELQVVARRHFGFRLVTFNHVQRHSEISPEVPSSVFWRLLRTLGNNCGAEWALQWFNYLQNLVSSGEPGMDRYWGPTVKGGVSCSDNKNWGLIEKCEYKVLEAKLVFFSPPVLLSVFSSFLDKDGKAGMHMTYIATYPSSL